jgi:Uma2 family endonuclease
VESDPHDIDRTYLRTTIGARLPRGWIILSSCRVDWGVPGIEPHGPDISVFKGLRGRKKNWKTFYVASEKAKPVAVVEITSSSTRVNDLKIKVDEYYRAGVPLYAIVDARERGNVRELQIIGYQSGERRYEKIQLDARGRLLLEPLGIWLGAEGGQVCCWDARTGERLEDYDDLFRDRESVRQEAEAERRARTAAEEEVRRLQLEIRRLRGQR